jgi:hypothetical protein
VTLLEFEGACQVEEEKQPTPEVQKVQPAGEVSDEVTGSATLVTSPPVVSPPTSSGRSKPCTALSLSLCCVGSLTRGPPLSVPPEWLWAGSTRPS